MISDISLVFCYVIHMWLLKYLGLRCVSIVLTYFSTLECHEKWKIHTKWCRSFSHQWVYTTGMTYAGVLVHMTTRPEGLEVLWLKSLTDGWINHKTYSICCCGQSESPLPLFFSQLVTKFGIFVWGDLAQQKLHWGIVVLRTAVRAGQRWPRTHVGLLEAAWLRQATWFEKSHCSDSGLLKHRRCPFGRSSQESGDQAVAIQKSSFTEASCATSVAQKPCATS